jgi:hypothetical protein
MNLKQIQQEIINYIENGNENCSRIINLINSTSNLNALDRLNIYRGSVIGGLTNTLAEIYPVCKKIVGEEFFNALALRYISNNPSNSFDLNQYGENFAELDQINLLAYLPDCAKYEWFCHLVLNSKQSNSIDIIKLKEIPVEKYPDTIFVPLKSSQLFYSKYPIKKIWEVNQDNYKGDMSVNLNSGNTRVILWLRDYSLCYQELSEELFLFLEALYLEQPLSEVIDKLENKISADKFGLVLNQAISSGFIEDFKLS